MNPLSSDTDVPADAVNTYLTDKSAPPGAVPSATLEADFNTVKSDAASLQIVVIEAQALPAIPDTSIQAWWKYALTNLLQGTALFRGYGVVPGAEDDLSLGEASSGRR